jgi:hypothetical protein
MYRFSRAIYRELAHDIVDGEHEKVLKACERTVERLALDRTYFARPTRTLFNDIRAHFGVHTQHRVLRVVDRYISCADDYLSKLPRSGYDAAGNPLQCKATTRRGTPCQRIPLPRNGYCPSHQHLAETEDAAPIAA